MITSPLRRLSAVTLFIVSLPLATRAQTNSALLIAPFPKEDAVKAEAGAVFLEGGHIAETEADDDFKRYWLAGIQDQPLLIGSPHGTDHMGVRFRPGGAHAFFGFPQDAVTDSVIELDLLLGRDAAESLRDRLWAAGSDRARATIKEIATLLTRIQADRISHGGGGADIGPSVQAGNLPAMSLEVDGDYFLIHHTPADTVDKIDAADMSRAAAAIAVMTYVIADMPERLESPGSSSR